MYGQPQEQELISLPSLATAAALEQWGSAPGSASKGGSAARLRLGMGKVPVGVPPKAEPIPALCREPETGEGVFKRAWPDFLIGHPF